MLGSPTGLMPEREQALLVPLGQRLADRLLQHHAEAEPLDHQRGRRFALAEAGHFHLPRQAAGGALQATTDQIGGNLHLDPHARVGQLCDDGLQGRRTLEDRARDGRGSVRPTPGDSGDAEVDREGRDRGPAGR